MVTQESEGDHHGICYKGPADESAQANKQAKTTTQDETTQSCNHAPVIVHCSSPVSSSMKEATTSPTTDSEYETDFKPTKASGKGKVKSKKVARQPVRRSLRRRSEVENLVNFENWGPQTQEDLISITEVENVSESQEDPEESEEDPDEKPADQQRGDQDHMHNEGNSCVGRSLGSDLHDDAPINLSNNTDNS